MSIVREDGRADGCVVLLKGGSAERAGDDDDDADGEGGEFGGEGFTIGCTVNRRGVGGKVNEMGSSC